MSLDIAALRLAMQGLAAAPPVAVAMPEWGGQTVYVKRMSTGEMDALSDSIQKGDKNTRLARSVARVLCNEEGVRIFDADSDDDVALLAAQPYDVNSKILEAAQKAAGHGDPDLGKASPPEQSS